MVATRWIAAFFVFWCCLLLALSTFSGTYCSKWQCIMNAFCRGSKSSWTLSLLKTQYYFAQLIANGHARNSFYFFKFLFIILTAHKCSSVVRTNEVRSKHVYGINPPIWFKNLKRIVAYNVSSSSISTHKCFNLQAKTKLLTTHEATFFQLDQYIVKKSNRSKWIWEEKV